MEEQPLFVLRGNEVNDQAVTENDRDERSKTRDERLRQLGDRNSFFGFLLGLMGRPQPPRRAPSDAGASERPANEQRPK